MKHYKLWMQVLFGVCVVYFVWCVFASDISPTYLPQCPYTISVSCPYAWCLKTLKPCYPEGDPVWGVCCADFPTTDPEYEFGCCQYESSNLKVCKCIDEQGIKRICVDRYRYAYYSGDCTRWGKWALPDPTYRCCVEGAKKGWCEYINYPCN